MAARIDAVELIKDRLDIVEALSVYAGADFSRTSMNRAKVSIKCPFHHDNSPSLTVFLADNRFRCWAGCNGGRHGDVIDVVRLAHNLSAAEAIKQLKRDLTIDSVGVDKETNARILAKRRELHKIKIDRETLKWTTDALQWLSVEITNQSIAIKTEAELEALAPFIHTHSVIEYKLDCLLGLEYIEESDKAEIIDWTKELMEGVRRLVGAEQHGETAIYKAG